MATFTRNDLFETELKARIEEEITRLEGAIGFGSLKSFEEYRYYTGKIAGLRSTLDYIEEVAASVSKKLL